MNFGLDGKVAMIAAASKGIGRASALSLAAEGCVVSVCSRNEKPLEDAAAELTQHSPTLGVVADVGVSTDLERWYASTIERFGRVDVLVTNTGGPPIARFSNLSDELWMKGIESTLMNVVRLTRLVLPGMQERKWGRIIHLTSLAAKEPIDDLTISSTLRAGLSALTKTMANQFGPDGITVNAVLMGHILTDRQLQVAQAQSTERGITSEEYLSETAQRIPLRRIGEPGEVGDVVAFLASDRAGYVTGVSLAVDGGAIRGV